MNDQLQKLLSDIQEKTDNKFSGLSSIIQDIGDGVTELYDEVYLTQGEVEGIKKVIETTNYQEKIDELSKQIADIQIIKGDKGDKGDNGKDGKNGKDGRDGKDGINGLNGRDGVDGIDGKDGSQDTPEQIAEKINTLENAIDIKALKDFPKIEDTTEIKRQVDTIGNQVLRLLSKKTETQVIDLSGYVPTTRTLTINGTALDLSADRSWTVAGGISSLNGLTGTTQTFATGTSGTDFSISSSGTVHTFNIPTASATNRGVLSSTDWTTFNNKFTLPSLTSGSVLFSNGTTIAQDNANFFWNNTNKRLGIGTATPAYTIDTAQTAQAHIGRMLLGNWPVASGYAYMGWEGLNQTVAGNYAFIQGIDGTYFNTQIGGNLGFRRNNSNLLYFPSAGGAQLSQKLGITSTTSVNTTRELSLTQANANPAMAFIRWDLTTNNTDILGQIQFNSELSAGGSGTERNAAFLEVQAAGTFTSTSTPGRFVFKTTPTGSTTPASRMIIDSTGNVGIGTTSPTGRLHLPAGSATANTAPLQFTTGTLETTARAGVMEYNNTPHFTNSDATRRHIVLSASATKTTAGAPYTNDGYITLNIGGIDVNVMTTA